MIRKVFRWVFGFVLRIFFRRIEMSGLERVPAEGPVLFVLNHPNGLIDPAFMMCLAPRPVSFLAKSTLFEMPIIGFIVRGFGALPVYRTVDGGGDNSETFRLSRQLLKSGGSIALFPEGASHSDPMMRPMKTGAARIALGAQLEGLKIVPAGLCYDAKGTFRSSALVYFSESFEVERVELEDGQPPRDEVRALTAEIERRLSAVTLQAEEAQALELIERAEQIFSAAKEAESSLSQSFELRQRFIEGHHRLRVTHPKAVAELERRIRRYEKGLRGMGLNPDHPSPSQFTLARSLSYALRSVAALSLLLPVAAVGIVIHTPAYRLIRHLAGRLYKGEDDVKSTIKVLGAVLFFPLTWMVCAALGGLIAGVWGAIIALAVGPATAWVGLVFLERFDSALGAARGLHLFLTRRRLFDRLHAERGLIREEIMALAQLL